MIQADYRLISIWWTCIDLVTHVAGRNQIHARRRKPVVIVGGSDGQHQRRERSRLTIEAVP